MRRTSGSFVRVVATIALAAGLGVAPAFAGSTDYLLELGGVDGESKDDKHKDQIEIQSFSWGATQTGSGFGHGGGGGTGKVAVHDISISRMPSSNDKQGGGEADALTDGLLILRANEQPAATASKDMTLKGSKIGENAPAPGGVQVAAGDVDGDGRADLVSPRDAASGLATGKRMHKPVTFLTPRDKGSLTIRGKLPGCAVGTRYPKLTLSGGGKRFTLQDAIITSCATVPGTAAMEEVSFNYAKIKT